MPIIDPEKSAARKALADLDAMTPAPTARQIADADKYDWHNQAEADKAAALYGNTTPTRQVANHSSASLSKHRTIRET